MKNRRIHCFNIRFYESQNVFDSKTKSKQQKTTTKEKQQQQQKDVKT